jgi:outer membrane protein assembly factor BamD
MMRSLAAIVFAVLLLAGCGLFSGNKDPQKNWTVEQFYEEARDNLDSGNYVAAVKSLEALQARYPYGRYAQQAQLYIAYCYYKQSDSPGAIAAADTYIKQYPNNAGTDYAYYIKGLANFNADLGLFSFIASNDLSDRDPKAAKEAFDVFKELVTRFPESRYVPDTRERMEYLINSLAKYEVHVANYYLKRGAPLAAANRAQAAVVTYPRAPATEEAIAIMIRAYDQLKLPDLRNDAARLMQDNFPNSRYLARVGTDKEWWKWW